VPSADLKGVTLSNRRSALSALCLLRPLPTRSGLNASGKDRDQLTALPQGGLHLIDTAQLQSLGELEPDLGFSQLLEADSHLVYEILTGLCALRLGIVRRWRGTTPKELASEVDSKR